MAGHVGMLLNTKAFGGESKAELRRTSRGRKVTVSDMVEVKDLDQHGNLGDTRQYRRQDGLSNDDSRVSALVAGSTDAEDTLAVDEDVYKGLDYCKRAPIEAHFDDCGDNTSSIMFSNEDDETIFNDVFWNSTLSRDEYDWQDIYEHLFDES